MLSLPTPRLHQLGANNTFYYQHGGMYVLSTAARNTEEQEIREKHGEREGGGHKRGEETIPLAQLSSDRWHRELIPGFSCVSPSTAPSRVSRGPPWQIWRAMWQSQHPWGGSQSRHVAFTFCAGGLAGPSLATAGVKESTFQHFGSESLQNCLYFKTHQQRGFMLVNCTSHTFSNPLLDSWHPPQSIKTLNVILILTYRQTGGKNHLASRAPEFRLFWGYSRSESCTFCVLAALNNKPSTAAPRL